MKSPLQRDVFQVAVIGGAACDPETGRLAYEVGAALARAGAVVICGGRGGVMEAASRGARDHEGLTVGILPGRDAATSPPNDSIQIRLFTGMGQARNLSVVLSAAAVIAVGGGWGTLSEIALAMKHRIPVVRLRSWKLDPPTGPDPLLLSADSPEEAVSLALRRGKPERLGTTPGED